MYNMMSVSGVQDSDSIFLEIILHFGLTWWLSGKESTCNAEGAGYLGLIPGWERSSGERHGNPLQYSCLENPMTEKPGGLRSIGSQRVRYG